MTGEITLIKIRHYLGALVSEIKIENYGNGFYNINKYVESTFCEILRIIYQKDFIVTENREVNMVAIDIASVDNEFVYQVSSQKTSRKIKTTYLKFFKNDYDKIYKKLHFIFLVDEYKGSLSTDKLKKYLKSNTNNRIKRIDNYNFASQAKYFDVPKFYKLIKEKCGTKELEKVAVLLESEFEYIKKNFSYAELKFEGISLKKVNDELKTKNILDALYSVVTSFKPMLVLPNSIIRNLYPFALNENKSARISEFTLLTNNKELLEFLKNIEFKNESYVYLGDDKSIKNDTNWDSKVNSIIQFLKNNRINNIEDKSFDSDLHLNLHKMFKYKRCECPKCKLTRFEFQKNTDLVSIKRNSTKNIGLRIRDAFTYYQYGYFEDSFKILKSVSEYAKSNNKFVAYFICEYNLTKLGRHLRRYGNDNYTKKILKRCNEISIDKLMMEFHILKVEREKIELLKYIYNGEFISNTFYEVDYLLENIRDKYQHDSEGGVSTNSNYIHLLDELSKFLTFLDGNHIFFFQFIEFKKVINKCFEGVLLMHLIKNKYSSRLDKVSKYSFNIFIQYIDPKELENLFLKYKVDSFLVSEKENNILIDLKKRTQNFKEKIKNINYNIKDQLKDSRDYFLKNKINKFISNTLIFLSYIEQPVDSFNICLFNMIKVIERFDYVYPATFNKLNKLLYKKSKIISISNVELLFTLQAKDGVKYIQWGKLKIEHLLHRRKLTKFSKDYINEEIAYLESNFEDLDIDLIIEIIKYCNKTQTKKISRLINKKLKKRFNHNIFYRAVIHELLDFEIFESQYINSIPKPIGKRKDSPDPFSRVDRFHFRINQLINVIFKFNLKLSKYKKIVPDEPYYNWLFNMRKFDYDNFNIEWILNYSTIYYVNKMIKANKIKMAIESHLKVQENKELSNLYFNHFV